MVTENSENLEDYKILSNNRFTLNPDENVRKEYSPESSKVSPPFSSNIQRELQRSRKIKEVNQDII